MSELDEGPGVNEAMYSISKKRLMELGYAERVLNWARGDIQDYVSGMPRDHVLDALFLTLTCEKAWDSILGPAQLTPDAILAGEETIGWK